MVREHFCDGFGDCLPGCPTGAITFEEREAPAYDEAAVKQAQQLKQQEKMQREGMQIPHGGCPGSRMRQMNRTENAEIVAESSATMKSQLCNWPVQIKLAPLQAPYFDGAKLLIASEAGCSELQREADGDSAEQRHSVRDHRAHGSALLRRTGNGGKEGYTGQRKVPALAGSDHLH